MSVLKEAIKEAEDKLSEIGLSIINASKPSGGKLKGLVVNKLLVNSELHERFLKTLLKIQAEQERAIQISFDNGHSKGFIVGRNSRGDNR